MIQTVFQTIQKEALGVTLAHEHIRMDRIGNTAKVKTYESMLEEYILDLKPCIDTYELNSLFDMTCIGMGREAVALQHLSNILDIHIVCGTGFYLPYTYPAFVQDASVEELRDVLLKEIREGVDSTGVLPGVIGEIGSEFNSFDETQQRIFLASIQASKESGLAIFTHCQLGTMIKEQVDFFLKHQANPAKVALGHCDLCNDFDTLLYALERGFNICFDTLGKNAYQSEQVRVDTAVNLIQRGYAKQLIFSNDITRRSYFRHNGGSGYVYLFDTFLPKLIERGVSNHDIEQIMVKNPGEVLDIVK